MAVFIGIMIIILGTAGIFASRAYCRFKAAREKEYGKETAEFFEAVNPLISDADTPTEILEIIDSLNDGIMDRTSAKRLLDQIIKHRGWQDKVAIRMSKKPNGAISGRSRFASVR